MSFNTYNRSFTIANTLNPDEKLTATKRPLGCMAIQIGSSVNV